MSAKIINLNSKTCDLFKCKVKNSSSIARFFLYYSPNIDSRLSKTDERPLIADDEIFNKLKIKQLKSVRNATLSSRGYVDQTLNLDLFSSFLKKRQNESYLDALLRILRNAIAHANIYKIIIKKKTLFFIVGEESEKKKKISLLLLSIDDLNWLKNLLVERYEILFK